MLDTPKDCAVEIHRFFEKQAGCGSFALKLVCTASHADALNLLRLRQAFPVLIDTLQEWRQTPTAKEFYEKYGINTTSEE